MTQTRDVDVRVQMAKCRHRSLSTPVPLIIALGEEEVIPENQCFPGISLTMAIRRLPSPIAAAPDQ